MEHEMQDHFNKTVYLLSDLYLKSIDKNWLHALVAFSEFKLRRNENRSLPAAWNVFNITIVTDYEVYSKFFPQIEKIAEIIRSDIKKISGLSIIKVRIFPNYDKIEISHNEIMPVYTEWEEINIGQAKLIDLLKKGSDSLDFQNIGNSSRTILQKMSNIVFKSDKHSPKVESIDVGPGKFKNRLHSYIKAELAGENNKELRQFTEAAIYMAEKTIDLANAVTHKLNAERIIAEACVVSTITTISIIKNIENKGTI